MGQHVLLLDLKFLPLRVDDVERIRQAAFKALGGQRYGSPCRSQRVCEVAQAILLRRIGIDRGIDLADSVKHCLLVGEQQFAATIVGPLDNSISRPKSRMGTAKAGPTDQIGLIRNGAIPVWRPAAAVIATCGKRSAVATPICAVALAS